LEFVKFENVAEVEEVIEYSDSVDFLLVAVDNCDLATGFALGLVECVDGPRASMNKSDSFNSAKNQMNLNQNFF